MTILNMVGGGGGSSGGYKSFTQLKAMTLAEAITELNTDPQGYYDNLNGNGHIIGIGIANDDKTTYQCFDSVTPIIYRNGAWRNGEIIIVKIKTNSNGDLKIPIGGLNGGEYSSNSPYNWRVSYDNGVEKQYSGTGSASTITIASGLVGNTEHTVVIRPNSESYKWARAFGYRNTFIEQYLIEIVYDGSYKGYGDSSTDTGHSFRSQQYGSCSNLLSGALEVLPNTVTSIGNYFRNHQYGGCSSFVSSLPKEVLPNTVTSIGNYFRAGQYYNCGNITTAPEEVLPNTVTSIGNYFRYQQYYNCGNITTIPEEVLPNTITSIGDYFRYQQYRGCTSLQVSSPEVLPNTVTSIGSYFRAQQYYGCSLLNEIKGWIDLSIGNSSYYRREQFYNCNTNKIVKVLSDVGGYGAYNANTLVDTYVSVVLVPSAYLNNFINSTKQPRSSITDSKFVGY